MGKQQDETRKIPQEGIAKDIPCTRKRVRGLTRLVKLHKDFKDSNGVKHIVEFDEVGRLAGKCKAEVASYLGDLVRRDVGLRQLQWTKVSQEVKDRLWEQVTRYYEVDVRMKKHMFNHLGEALRSFRARLYKNFIRPNINKPSKLKVVPEQYKAVVDQTDWDNFVKNRLSDKFQGVSKSAKDARAMHKYPHRLGRSGYVGLREKLVKDKELPEDELPMRSFMWRRARANKDGDYKNNDIREVANKIADHEKDIHDGSIKPEHGTDALTLVFGKEHAGRVRGAGKGVTPTRYWNTPTRRGSSKDRIAQLQLQLDNERRERESSEEEVKALNKKMDAILAHFSTQGIGLPNLETTTNTNSEGRKSLKSGLLASQETPAPGNCSDGFRLDRTIVKSSSTHQQSSVVDCTPASKAAQTHALTNESPLTIKCRLAYPDLRNIVARGTIFYSTLEQTVHGVPLSDDCYRVSVDETLKPAAFLPIQAGEHKTVEEAYGSFVAWPKKLVIPDSKVLQTSDQQKKKQNPKKRSKSYTTIDQMRKTPKHTRGSVSKEKNVLED